MEVVFNEVVLERALVGVVADNKPNLNVSNVQAYIMGHFGAPPGSFRPPAPPEGLPGPSWSSSATLL
jgi:hypothetical protein